MFVQDQEGEVTVARLQRDKAELEEVNARLTQQLAQARAAQLAATKVQLPRLAESLLHEKNQEIDALHRQLQLLHHHSTANSLAGSSRDSRLSGERMRDAFPAAMPSAELSYLTSRMEGRDTHPDKPRPFLETGTPNSFHDARRSELSLSGVTPEEGETETKDSSPEMAQRTNVSPANRSENRNESGLSLAETADSSQQVSLPNMNVTPSPEEAAPAGGEEASTSRSAAGEEAGQEMAAMLQLLQQRTQDIESLSVLINEKDHLLYELQDKALEADQLIRQQEQTIKQLTASTLQLKAEMASKADQLEEVVNERAVVIDQLSEMQASLDVKTTLVQELTGLNSEQARQLAELQADMQRLQEWRKGAELESQRSPYRQRDLGANTGGNFTEELQRLRDENADQRDGLANLHSIINSCHDEADKRRAELGSRQKELEVCQSELTRCRKELEEKANIENKLHFELTKRANIECELRCELEKKIHDENDLLSKLKKKDSIEKELRSELVMKLNIENELQSELEKKTNFESSLRSDLSTRDGQVKELEAKMASRELAELASVQDANAEKIARDRQLADSALQLAAFHSKIKELTDRFRTDLQLKEQEKETLQIEYYSMRELKDNLETRCQELDARHQEMSGRITSLEQVLATRESEVERSLRKDCLSEDKADSVEAGSLDDLTSLVQRELEVSSELDQSLLNQLVSRDKDVVSRINSDTNNILGRSEVQRLLQKVQDEGSAVLSLSERLFLAQHSAGSGHPQSEVQSEAAERDWGRRMEILHFKLQQEKVITEDLRCAVDSEKRHSLELLSSLSRERQQKSNLEEELVALRRQLKQRSLSLVSDSENEEFLNTIEAQKRQIESLEESLQREKENFEQLQKVLQVERLRLRQDSPDGRQAHSGSADEAPGEVATLIISHLRRELDEERRRVGELLLDLDSEKRQQQHPQLTSRRSEAALNGWGGGLEAAVQPAGKDDPWTEAWRTREYELERLVAELELKLELLEREGARLREINQRLELELHEERERATSGKHDNINMLK